MDIKKIIVWFLNTLNTDYQCNLYRGCFNDEITGQIIQISEHKLNKENEKLTIRKRFSYLLAESFQNVIRHSSFQNTNTETNFENSFFMTRTSEGIHYIASGNPINNGQIDDLKKQLDQVNSLDSEALKNLYRKVITKGKMSEKGGAGLGLIDMARKSGHKIGYRFKHYNPTHSLFYNQIVLTSDRAFDENILPVHKIDFAINLHQKMVEDNIVMLQKADFRRTSIIPVLKIVKNNIATSGKNSSQTKAVFHIIIELLQNIRQHGYCANEDKMGIFILSENIEKYTVSVGNYIENNKVHNLRKIIEKINRMDKKQLDEAYLLQLRATEKKKNKITGVGLLDIARITSEKFNFQFNEIDDNISFFTIVISYCK